MLEGRTTPFAKGRMAVIALFVLLALASMTLSGEPRGNHRNSLASVYQARLFFHPETVTVRAGETVEVSLRLSLRSEPANAVGGRILIPTDFLEIESISTEGSFQNMWLPGAPYFSKEEGVVVFDGGLPNPGFMGENGLVLTLTLRGIKAGRSDLSLKTAEVLANDGQGTNIPAETVIAHIIVTKGIPGDLDEDGKVSLRDVSALVANWGAPKDATADIDGDGIVDLRDVSILFSRYGGKK